ncbi:cobalamin biosynthesis protein [Antarcticirhabdus aurantiaca]|uniref:Cobalamin biosynthesis protein n=1 Tax=Antarcticirhabdus aurantiaca TaxID=2606717 RepID=A0ACD4NHN9_9HYPH|nr:cobalamin biosynthesis protein [Antarcticirhabdus aurantiaca]WAJ26338.1 cobalamin biosynthesis protein [Jeongeuplla avenae]
MRLVAGIGCRRGVDAAAVIAAVEAALSAHNCSADRLSALATSEAKAAAEPSLAEAARFLGLPLLVAPREALAGVCAITRSERSLAVTGTASLSETAALAAAGPGARLLGARLALGPVTCALAQAEEAP